jgi:transposase
VEASSFKLGEAVTETLESIPRRYKVIQRVREKFSCRGCETITQPPAPFHPIARGRAGSDLLATIMHAKFGEHQPLNRQSVRFAREGVDLSVSTLADWEGACTTALSPLVTLIHAHVLAAERIHGDDTTVPVLVRGKTITGRLWIYVRDDRPFGGPSQLAAMFYYSRDHGGEHPTQPWQGSPRLYSGRAATAHDERAAHRPAGSDMAASQLRGHWPCTHGKGAPGA